MLTEGAVRRLQFLDRTRETVARSRDLARRLRRAGSEYERTRTYTHRVHRLCWADYARVWAERSLRRGDPQSGMTWFALEGVIDGTLVRGAWAPGHLKCSPLLDARARLLIDLDEYFLVEDPPGFVHASLDGPAAAVALTLMRACDRTLSVQMGLSARTS